MTPWLSENASEMPYSRTAGSLDAGSGHPVRFDLNQTAQKVPRSVYRVATLFRGFIPPRGVRTPEPRWSVIAARYFRPPDSSTSNESDTCVTRL